jgi:hypothetical protein
LSPIIKKQLACKTLTPDSFKFTGEGTARNIAKGDLPPPFGGDTSSVRSVRILAVDTSRNLEK